MQYIGETENPLHIRMNGHHSDITMRKLDKPLASHFNQPDYSLEDLKVMGIEKISNVIGFNAMSFSRWWKSISLSYRDKEGSSTAILGGMHEGAWTNCKFQIWKVLMERVSFYKTPIDISHCLHVADVNLQCRCECIYTQCKCESCRSQQGYCNHLCHTRIPVIFLCWWRHSIFTHVQYVRFISWHVWLYPLYHACIYVLYIFWPLKSN